jgi:hypothetical protein
MQERMTMKKIISIIVAVCVAISLSVNVFADDGVFISDNAGFFSDSEYSRLLDKADEIAADRGWCIMIITETGDYSESAARRELRDWYRDEFGSSTKGVGFIMTSETTSSSGRTGKR